MIQLLNENTHKMHFEDILLVSTGILGTLGKSLLVRNFEIVEIYKFSTPFENLRDYQIL
jgi:hypothetical protein